jgi:hypothetical protein
MSANRCSLNLENLSGKEEGLAPAAGVDSKSETGGKPPFLT